MQHTSSEHTNDKGCMLHQLVVFIHFTEHISYFSEVYLAPDDDVLYIDIRVQHKTLQQNLNRKLH